MKVGFVGLGVMGFPMAGHLAKACHELSVFNRLTRLKPRATALLTGLLMRLLVHRGRLSAPAKAVCAAGRLALM